ncbi:MAG TPA: IS110 family transposase [Kiritimatiellia bacterium]|nr:IS110 family transposase [Kiritimatiellia bacterium]HPR69831.1 IS110 family transposase [Kiritimatiellia bacterium]
MTPLYLGVDFHPRSQMVSWVNPATGETETVRLRHEDAAVVRTFYQHVGGPPAVIGLEASSCSLWFERLVEGLGYTVWHGDPAKIRRLIGDRRKNDAWDSRGILALLQQERFPRVWRREPAAVDALTLLRLRHQLVKMRTMARNGLQAVAFLVGRVKKQRLGVRQIASLQAQDLGRAALNRKRDELAALEAYLSQRIAGLETELETLAEADPQVVRLRTHPGIGRLTALALVHTLAPVERFQRSRQVVAYAGLEPRERSSGDRTGTGGITKAGSRLLRFLLVEAAHTASRLDPELSRIFKQLGFRRGRPKAVTAIARRLLVRAWIMLRDGIDYAEFCRRGQLRRLERPRLA